ncbi:response regulator transcription factor [Halocella sp. SP3-1]|uniref:response regulator transcription factor n=1 Tax=Halocella sp. SP3-1 TaxID=2382161 RepID=UPI000F765BAE|nr:response regulator transcription factor [Halocella sp. SP3-1]AZO94853.1 DNA-binding response regulator [Halocella sp. SP3-1]
MSKEKILIADDEEYIRKIIKKTLSRENMIIFEANCGKKVLNIMAQKPFDLIILDIMIGDIDGLDIIKKIRTDGIHIPIILITGKKIKDYDKILGLGIGADDYITKPFNPAVLCAHVKAHLRRNKNLNSLKQQTKELIVEPFRLNLDTYKLYKNEKEISLSAKELMMIKFFMENPNQVFSKEQLYQNIWGDSFINDNSIMVYINHLRHKIETNPKKPKFIQTVWGIGYKFVGKSI